MPLHDYRCPVCGTEVIDVYVPVTERASQRAPICSGAECGNQPMDWLPQIGSMGLIQDSAREVIQVLQPDGSHKPVEITSLADIRRLERESEIAYRNGEGQPLRWRAYSQDKSNDDVPLFADPSERPDPEFLKKNSVQSTDEAGAEKLGYGPGVSDNTTSSLAD